MTHRALRRAGWNTLGLLVFAVMVFPVFWMISTAFKPTDEINTVTPTWFSASPTLAHFRAALDRPYFWTDVKNSLVVVSVTVVIAVALAFLAAIALAKYRFTGRKLFVILVIGIQMLPAAGLIIPLYVLLAKYHQVNKLTGVILVYLTAALPFSVWTLRGFLIGIPKDLEEAAMVDGSTRLGALAIWSSPGAAACPPSRCSSSPIRWSAAAATGHATGPCPRRCSTPSCGGCVRPSRRSGTRDGTW